MKRSIPLLLSLSALSAAAAAPAQPANNGQAVLRALEGAAPIEILNQATIMNMNADGSMATIRMGTNGWTCMPQPAPMCADGPAMDWAHGWMTKGPAPQKLGFIYMLKGDAGASNTDPYASGETPANNWIVTGPHVMIVGAEAKSLMQAYPRAAKADPRKPYVMWPGTPYEHLMIPVQ